jgi:hypothetical protein
MANRNEAFWGAEAMVVRTINYEPERGRLDMDKVATDILNKLGKLEMKNGEDREIVDNQSDYVVRVSLDEYDVPVYGFHGNKKYTISAFYRPQIKGTVFVKITEGYRINTYQFERGIDDNPKNVEILKNIVDCFVE